MHISGKILGPVILALMVTAGFVTFYGVVTQNSLIENEDQQQLKALSDTFQSRLDAQGEMAKALATSLAALPEVQQAFAEGDREALIDQLQPTYTALNEQFGVPQAQFHLPPATSMLRLHSLDKFGDDLSAFRSTVIVANRDQVAVSGLEKGKGGYGIRGVVPVVQAERHLGTFEIGLDFDQRFLDSFKESYKVEVSVYLYQEESKVETFAEADGEQAADSAFAAYASTMSEPAALDEALFQQVVTTAEPTFAQLTHQNVPYSIVLAPLFDYAGDVVGVIVINHDRSAALAQMSYNRTVSLAVAGAVVLVMALAIWQLLAYLVIRPTRRLTTVAGHIAVGDVEVAVPDTDRQDEIGVLARTFQDSVIYLREMANVADHLAQSDFTVKVRPRSEKDALGQACGRLVENLRYLLAQVLQDAKSIDEFSHQLVELTLQASAATQQMAAATQEQAADVSHVSQATGQISTSLESVAANAQQGAVLAAEAAEVARAGTSKVEVTVREMEKIKAKAGQSAQRVREMGEQSAQIEMIVNTIDEIAAQTNLLALNAAIEAARAGEHGRGFAVVADEVRKLAEKSTGATQEIAGLINGIRAAVTEAVTAMEASTTEIDRGVDRANEAGQALYQIRASVDEVNRQITEIAGAAQHINAASEELVAATSRVSAVIDENSAVTEEMTAQVIDVSDATRSLQHMTSDLYAVVFNFKVSDEADFGGQIATFQQAHHNWVQRVETMLAGGEPIKPHSHTECLLGRWYAQRGQADFGQLAEFVALAAPHEKLHVLLQEVTLAHQQGDKAAAQRLFAELRHTSQTVVAELEALKNRVLQTEVPLESLANATPLAHPLTSSPVLEVAQNRH